MGFVDAYYGEPAVLGAPAGVRVLRAAGRNRPGTGRLTYRTDGEALLLAWQPPGDVPGLDVPIDGASADLCGLDEDRWVQLEIYADFLQTYGDSAEVLLRDCYGAMPCDADVTAEDALAGQIEYSETLLVNNGDHRIDPYLWLDPATPDLEISVNGSSYSAPTDPSQALHMAPIAAGGNGRIYFRRTIPAESPADPKVRNIVYIDFCDP
jgi:hypothetical protein